ncbi:MAG: DUF4281 domain-containing protein [Rhodothermales bacterium]|nr:DUF4281 domain-containing protein [Rhodothermales bacterium]
MDPAALFSFGSTLVLPGWLLLVFAPRWKWTTGLVTTVLIPVALGIVYIYLMATNFGNSEGGFGSLEEVTKLFSNPALVTAGWLHYLAFDMLVGSWIVRNATQNGVPHLLVIPCLVLCFLAGPVGYVLYLVIRAVKTREILMAPVSGGAS